MVAFERILPDGQKVATALRMDSQTGETWILQQDKLKWVSIEDNLQRVEEWEQGPDGELRRKQSGIKTVDGRDLRDLSKEELIRLLSTKDEPFDTAYQGGASDMPTTVVIEDEEIQRILRILEETQREKEKEMEEGSRDAAHR